MLTKKSVLIAICFLVMQITMGDAVVHVNETLGDFRISFDASNDTNMIGKYWNTTGSGVFGSLPHINISNAYMVVAGNINSKNTRWSGVAVLISKEPINTSYIEENLFKNSTVSYIREEDRVIDGHQGVLAFSGNGPEDPLMNYTAFYWLDETSGMATQLVAAIAQLPWNEGAETLINTTHVEDTSKK